ncbi:MAG: hypothetical protein ACR2OI_02375, partial [Acidimicrobiia bacterium]
GLRWLRVPFSSGALALALIGAAAVPAFLLAAADLWETAAGDELTRRVIADGSGQSLGLEVSTDAYFVTEAVAGADAAMEEAFGRIDRLEAPVRSLYTTRGWGLIGPDYRPSPVQVRMIARPGGIESLEVVEASGQEPGGVWISDWLAQEGNIRVGDKLTYSSTLEPEQPGAEAEPAGGPTSEFTVAGIYRALWNQSGDPPPAAWTNAPDGLVPVYIRPFMAPNFSLLITDEASLANSGVSGLVEWRAELPEVPDSRADLASLAAEYAALEGSLTVDTGLAAALNELSPVAAPPEVRSPVAGILDEVNSLVARLGQPLGSVKSAGIAVGIAVMMASAVLAVERRGPEYRLLAGEGDRWGSFTSRAAAQLVLPTAIGAVVGVALAVIVAALSFDQVALADTVRPGPIVVVGGIGLAAAALTTGVLAQATLGSGRIGAKRALWPSAAILVGIAGYLWIQVGRSRTLGSGSVDLTVAALPIVALLAAVSVMLLALEVVARRSRRSRRGLPAIPLLAWRRVTAESVGARLIVGALGVGIGLIVFSTILVATLQRSVDVKSAISVGAETSIELLAHPPSYVELPAGSTIVGVQATRTSPGDGNVTMIALDPATFPDAVSWPEELGGSPEQLLEFLESDVGYNLPVVGIAGQNPPVVGGFGSFQSSPYQVVARFRSLPLASERSPTLVVSADRLDQFELDRVAPGLGLSPNDPEVEDLFVSPVERYRPFLVSQSTPAELMPFLEANELVVRDVVTRDGIRGAVDTIGASFAFDYLRLLGYVGAATSGVALALYLAARRKRRALASVMTRRMGLGSRAAAVVTTLEVAVLSGIAAITAALLAPRVTERLIPRFDPSPGIPP